MKGVKNEGKGIREGRMALRVAGAHAAGGAPRGRVQHPQPVVKKIDHVAIGSGQPGALFATFTKTLGLPQAWPFVSYPGFATGGVFMGNVNVETLQVSQVGAGNSLFYGIVLDPYPLAQSVPAMQARGGQPSAPQVQYREIGGTQVKFWTNVTLKSLCAGSYIVYLCEYTALAKKALTAGTAGLKPPLGKVGLQSVREMVITARDPQATVQQWQQVLAPLGMTSDGALAIGSGPAVHVIKGTRDRISGMIWQVASLSNAKTFLKQKGMLGTATANSVKIAPAAVQGLDITLVQ